MIRVYGDNDYTVYFRQIEDESSSSDISVHSFVNEDGLFTELINEGVTILIEADEPENEEVDEDFIKSYYTEHVAKVNKMLKSLGTNKKVDSATFVNNVAYQLTEKAISNAQSVKGNGNKSRISFFEGMF